MHMLLIRLQSNFDSPAPERKDAFYDWQWLDVAFPTTRFDDFSDNTTHNSIFDKKFEMTFSIA